MTQSQKEKKKLKALNLPFKDGHYIEFRSKEGFDLITKDLENRRSDIRILNIKEKINVQKTDNKIQQKTTLATVYFPNKKISLFLKKIDQYLNQTKTQSKQYSHFKRHLKK